MFMIIIKMLSQTCLCRFKIHSPFTDSPEYIKHCIYTHEVAKQMFMLDKPSNYIKISKKDEEEISKIIWTLTHLEKTHINNKKKLINNVYSEINQCIDTSVFLLWSQWYINYSDSFYNSIAKDYNLKFNIKI